MPFVESLSFTRAGTGGLEIGGVLADECLLPLARALLRAEAEVLTTAGAQDIARTVSPKALPQLVLQVLSAPLGPRYHHRQVAAMFRHRADLRLALDQIPSAPWTLPRS